MMNAAFLIATYALFTRATGQFDLTFMHLGDALDDGRNLGVAVLG
jgi:hypothetical protein